MASWQHFPCAEFPHSPFLFSVLPYSAERVRQGEFAVSRLKKRKISFLFLFLFFLLRLGSWLSYKQMLHVICSQCREAASSLQRFYRLKDCLSLIYAYCYYYYYYQRAVNRNCKNTKKETSLVFCYRLLFSPPCLPLHHFLSFFLLFFFFFCLTLSHPLPELPFGVVLLL